MEALATSCLLVMLAGAQVQAADNALQIRIDPQVAYQTIDGFGASDAWRCQFVGEHWPLEKRERIADMLFSREVDDDGNPRGIGLSIWRFYINAGTAEQGDDSDIRNVWRRGECFQNPDGTYDWSKQAGQQWFLQAAHRRGVERFLAFPKSPPVHMTFNGKGYADAGRPVMNIRPGRLGDYAAFLADVLEYFDQQGMPFDYLSPFNEPQWNWERPGQEGTPAQNIELYALIRYLSHELSTRNLSTRMVVGEAGTINHLARHVERDGRDNQAHFFFSPESLFYIGDLPNVERIISAHSYFTVWPLDRQVRDRRRLRRALDAAYPELGYWQSEYCILQANDEIRRGQRRDLGMDTALYVARIMHNDLTLARAQSWQWWTAVTQADYKDGLVYLDDGSRGASGAMGPNEPSLMRDGEVRESKLLWVMGNYARFVRPGMTRIGCDVAPTQSVEDGLLASAYRGDDGPVVLVLTNLSTEEQRCDLGIEGDVEVYTTSPEQNLEKGRQEGANLIIPARAVVTALIPLLLCSK